MAVPEGRGMSGPATTAAVELVGASRWYGNVVAVNDITFRLDGGVTGLLGPNGAGKSTLLHMIAGFLAPSSGSVTVGGEPSRGHPEMYRRIGLVPEREAVYPFLTGREFAMANARLYGMSPAEAAEAASRAIALVELEDAADRAIGTYSKGMRQRAKVAAALVHDPTILLLDEPFNGMDPRQRLHMMSLLRGMAAEGRTILFSSHILEEVERLAERVLVIVAGRLAASGDFREIRRLMTDRPHTFTVRSSDDRALAAALLREPTIAGAALDGGLLTVRSTDFGAFSRAVSGVARRSGIRLHELLPTDESLESVFSYLVRR
jgi:ABC-2 type transport system ATP-binding protein